MKKIALFLLTTTILSCGGSKSKHVVTTKSESHTVSQTEPKRNRKRPSRNTKKTEESIIGTHSDPSYNTIRADNPTIANIISSAKSYEGVRYKYGGTTKKGMDCSGLLYTAFKTEDIALPRTSSAMSEHGEWIDVKQVEEGDLLFFATRKNSRTINHVGLVTSSRPGRVEFIHASTSKGVMTSLLSERYWYFAFVQARRVL
ncbi:C40 family peptidase [Olleya sp. HaHaR_3_96]|uniref:C40 family peptidase n=1 Tax=Olleya sp. HaHaR_3_96 TaxID=2745560 RepID=UPI001C4F2328|nr:C40 family peptidase [Olleya sp. HaHaR_3_96]QXP61114.1 C40 family peptidase [Olleya sp. HaHaR_3_96]